MQSKQALHELHSTNNINININRFLFGIQSRIYTQRRWFVCKAHEFNGTTFHILGFAFLESVHPFVYYLLLSYAMVKAMLPYELRVEHSISHSKRYLPTWMTNVCDRRNYNHLITVANIFYRNSDHHDWFIDLVNFIFQCFKLFSSSKFPPVSMQCDDVSPIHCIWYNANEKFHTHIVVYFKL